jgi:integrase
MVVWTGFRKGELAGLQWGDITRRKISVKQAVDWSLGETNPELKLPKTEAGIRDIPLASIVVDALTAYRVWQGEIFLKAGRPMIDETHIFFNDRTFGILHKSVSQHRWEKLMKKTGLEKRSMHKNRHTFSSRAIRVLQEPFEAAFVLSCYRECWATLK